MPIALHRVLAALAATFLVLAVAVASILPPNQTLGAALADLDPNLLARWQAGQDQAVGPWLWLHTIQPLLARPAWLIPFAFGIVCLGALASLTWLRTPTPSRRRRS